MVHDSEQIDSEGRVSQFEKNRFFQGKLMTARDMEAEQSYHAERLELLARHTVGSGIVRGLTVRSVEEADGELTVSIDSGVAVDGCGRPIIIDTPATKTLPAPDSNVCHLYLRFDEIPLESVPAPDADSPTTETTANRLIEVFELTYRESPPDRHRPTVDLDADSFGGETVDTGRLAAAVDDRYRTVDGEEDPAVYLGGFERGPDGSWGRLETAPLPTYAIDHELLSTAFIEHLADTDNPHETEVDVESPEPDLDPDELESIHERVDYLQSELSALKDRQLTTTAHLRQKALTTTARLFRSTATTFADHDGVVSRAARTIAQQAETASRRDVGSDPEQFVTTLRDLHAPLADFGDELSGVASEATADRYRERLADFRSTLEADRPAVEAAIALDDVAETAVELDVLHPATPEQ